MTIQQQPEAGTWYMSLSGQLIKVWAVSYRNGRLEKVVIEFLNGHKRMIGIEKWNLLNLVVRPQTGQAERRKNTERFRH